MNGSDVNQRWLIRRHKQTDFIYFCVFLLLNISISRWEKFLFLAGLWYVTEMTMGVQRVVVYMQCGIYLCRELFTVFLVPTLQCFMVFWLSHWYHCPPVTHQGSIWSFSLLPFPLYPLRSLPLWHSSTIHAVYEKSSTLRRNHHTERHSAFCKHTCSYRSAKKCKHMRAWCINVPIWDVRKTKQDAGSDHLRRDQLNSGSCLTPMAPVAHSDKGHSCLFKLYMWGQVFDEGGSNLWTLTLIQTWPCGPWSRDRHRVKSASNNKTWPVLHSSQLISINMKPLICCCLRETHIFLHRKNTQTGWI